MTEEIQGQVLREYCLVVIDTLKSIHVDGQVLKEPCFHLVRALYQLMDELQDVMHTISRYNEKNAHKTFTVGVAALLMYWLVAVVMSSLWESCGFSRGRFLLNIGWLFFGLLVAWYAIRVALD